MTGAAPPTQSPGLQRVIAAGAVAPSISGRRPADWPTSEIRVVQRLAASSLFYSFAWSRCCLLLLCCRPLLRALAALPLLPPRRPLRSRQFPPSSSAVRLWGASRTEKSSSHPPIHPTASTTFAPSSQRHDSRRPVPALCCTNHAHTHARNDTGCLLIACFVLLAVSALVVESPSRLRLRKSCAK